MTKPIKRSLLGKGKGYLNAAGPQSRFIIFLIFVLVAYTFLLLVFQKLARFPQIQLPVFLVISLATLLLFIGIVGTVYSHAFAGPLRRIRNTVDRLAHGDLSITLRLRESDDRMLRELSESITLLCEHTKNANASVRTAAQELFSEISSLDESVRDADTAGIRQRMELVRQKQESLEQSLSGLAKP